MGFEQSKSRIVESERHRKTLVKQNIGMEKQLVVSEEARKKETMAVFEKITEILRSVSNPNSHEDVLNEDKAEIKIGGTTYEIIQFVNRGGFGEIYKARVKSTQRIVAIKRMLYEPGIEDEVNGEISFLRIIKKIGIENHPVIEYCGSEITKEYIFIAMEFALCDLYTFWKKRTFSESAEKITIFGTIIVVYILRALAFLEKLHIVHGDIKPQNIALVPYRDYFSIKLIDFGSAEKLNTHRSQVTVDSSKMYTVYFASPEFLKYNQRGVRTKHFHKKSDAWAAGVMFYYLFCGKFPWDNEDTYRRFCNDQNAEDIKVPVANGYQIIIELLLKRDPEERSSALDTLAQLKEHPQFGKIITSLNKHFSPVDDVCDIDVPDEVRQELIKLARPGHYTIQPDTATNTTEDETRIRCRFKERCKNKEPLHLKRFSHPDDSDYQVLERNEEQCPEKRKCRYGVSCYRTDEFHLAKFSHPPKAESDYQEEKQPSSFENPTASHWNNIKPNTDDTIRISMMSSRPSMVTLKPEHFTRERLQGLQTSDLYRLPQNQNADRRNTNCRPGMSNSDSPTSNECSYI